MKMLHPSTSRKETHFFLSVWLRSPVWLRRYAYRFLVRIGEYTWPQEASFMNSVQRLPFGMYVKFRGCIDWAEVAAIRFIGENTTIKVPRIIDVVTDDKGQLIVIMTRLKGELLAGRLNSMDQNTRNKFQDDLRDSLHQLRKFSPPSEVVSDFLGGPTLQFNIDMDREMGPWPNIQAFHDFLLDGVPSTSKLRNVSSKSFDKPHRLVLTHGDLSPSNILVDAQGRLAGIVDFGSCGWFPEYWDYVNAMCCRDVVYTEWAKVLTAIYPGYEDDLNAMKHYWDDHNPYSFYDMLGRT